MATTTDSLGGRLDLLAPDTLSADQRAFYDQLREKTVPWAEKSGFKAVTNDKELIGPFNAMLLSPAIGKAMMNFDSVEQEHTTLSEKVRQVIILTVGAVWQADYEVYAHTAAARKADLSEDVIKALTAGSAADGLSDEEVVAQRFTKEIAATHRMSDETYRQAVDAFGEKGVFDMVALAGQYMSISALLNTFAVPAPEANL